MKTISFARKFQGKHHRCGDKTHFVERILNSLGIEYFESKYLDLLMDLNKEKIAIYGNDYIDMLCIFRVSLNPIITGEKLHTIRASNHFKPSEYFSPVVWADKPYRSPQIIFAPPTEIKQIIPFDIDGGNFYLGSPMRNVDDKVELIARNEGLSEQDFKDWFKYPKPFEGNIIAWGETNY